MKSKVKIYLDENDISKYKSKKYTDDFLDEIIQIFDDKNDSYKNCVDDRCDDEGCVLWHKLQEYIKYKEYWMTTEHQYINYVKNMIKDQK